jgi:hypothetical protein
MAACKHFLGIPRDGSGQRYVISRPSCLHQVHKLLINSYVKGTHAFGHPVNKHRADNGLDKFVGRVSDDGVPDFRLGMLSM